MVAESLAARFGKIAAIFGVFAVFCLLTLDQNRFSVTSNAAYGKKFLRFVVFRVFRDLHEVHESAQCYSNTYFLKSFANASRASEGGPEEVWRSTTIRVANSSQELRACLSTIRAGIVLLHSRRAPGSK